MREESHAHEWEWQLIRRQRRSMETSCFRVHLDLPDHEGSEDSYPPLKLSKKQEKKRRDRKKKDDIERKREKERKKEEDVRKKERQI